MMVIPAADTVTGSGDKVGGPREYVDWRRIVNRLAITLALAVLAFGPAGAGAAPATLIMLGDSLTAGYGLAAPEALPAQMEAALRAAGHEVRVVNAGVSGDTSAGGLARLDWVLPPPDATGSEAVLRVVVALGANDALRGLDPDSTYANLDGILRQLAERRIPVLLAGMYAPPNLGADYVGEFNAIYPRLAETHGTPLYPFLLDGVAAIPALNQTDGIHPNAAGVAVMVDRMLPAVLELLGSD